MEGRIIIQRYLSLEERDLYVNNTLKMSLTEFSEMMNKYWGDPEGIISSSFEWDETPEGHDYWHNIYRRVEVGDVVNPTIEPRKLIPTHKL